MARATENLDLAEVLATLESWRQIAWLTSANGPAGYRRILAKAEHVQHTGEHPLVACRGVSSKRSLGFRSELRARRRSGTVTRFHAQVVQLSPLRWGRRGADQWRWSGPAA